jgi:hypothetical protein
MDSLAEIGGMIGIGSSLAHGFVSWWDRATGAAPPGDLVAEIAYLPQGGALVTLRGLPAGALFEPGPIEVPEAVIKVLERSGRYAWPFLLRHVEGDWGVHGWAEAAGGSGVKSDKGRALRHDAAGRNVRALQMKEGRVVSEFETTDGDRFWIITHMGAGGYTTFLVSG